MKVSSFGRIQYFLKRLLFMVAERKTFNAWQEDIGSLNANTNNAMLTACKKWTLSTGELNTPLKLTNFWYKVQI